MPFEAVQRCHNDSTASYHDVVKADKNLILSDILQVLWGQWDDLLRDQMESLGTGLAVDEP